MNYASVREALEAMSVNSELHVITLLGSSLKNLADETLPSLHRCVKNLCKLSVENDRLSVNSVDAL